jgi:superfamily II DNA or RNA helicase
MQLKKYQQKTLDELEKYIAELKKYDTEKTAGVAFMVQTGKPYNWVTEIGHSPFVCIKVPTGGGKTLIAAHSLGLIFKDYLGEMSDKGLVMWFVPSDAIKTQTLDNLRNRNHPYREELDQRFNNGVKVFDLTEAKSIKKDDLADNLCIVVSTLSAFRRTDKEWLKAYQDNGALMAHFEELNPADFDFLDKDKEGNIIYSLANVIKLHNPLVIADEGHNVQTGLALDMLQGLNPCFVLEFTATPKGQSNILVNISAKELKDEKMIKMPIYLANKTPWQETIYDGIDKLRDLEKRTKKNKGEYIRPVMLLQAEQDMENPNKIYVGKIRQFLIEDAKIQPEQIAIQTSRKKELPKMEILLGRRCPIRYIITVNALREGWDCPFAYVLVSVSNLGARLSVEQTIGRIMRLPNAKEKSDAALNSAYIFASTRNFNQTSEMIINGLHANGYEDIVPISGGVAVAADEYKKIIQDKNIVIPFINIKDGKVLRKLDYVSDLIGSNSPLKNQNPELDFQIIDDGRMVKIDIGKEGELIRDAAGKLNLTYHYKDFTKENLLAWFRKKIQRGFISIQEMNAYLEKIIDELIKKYPLNELSVNCYQIKEAIEKNIDGLVDTATTKKFIDLLKASSVVGHGENFPINDLISILNPCPDNFQNHLYEKSGKMNQEELTFAYILDGLDNIAWWFRNSEIHGFYIQGWLKPKFYPDFIVKTKTNNYFILEYKGEHLEEAIDARYKKEIGNKWAELAGKKYRFSLFGKNEIDNIIKEISQS